MRIGFTGHRPNRLHFGVERICARLDEALSYLCREVRAKGVEEQMTAVSPLAEGSDRLFAECALRLGFALEALLPMPVDEYLKTFEAPAATPNFHRLLAQAVRSRELTGSLIDSKAAYEALGHEIVEACDVLVAVWDAKPAAGRGGTPEVIENALDYGRRVIWVDAARDREPVHLKAINPLTEVALLLE
jgi:hypothetical protein